MGGEIEGDGQALLPGGEIAPVEGVGIFRGGEAGILPDGPGLRRVHRGVGAAQERRFAGIGVEEIEPGEIGLTVNGLHRNGFGRNPGRGRAVAGGNRRVGKIDLGEVGNLTHLIAQNIMRRLQGRNHVAAHINEGFHACLPPLVLAFARPSSEVDGCAGGGQRLGGVGRLHLVNLVRRAQAGELGAGGLERRDHLGLILEAVIAQGLDAAGFVEILRERGACGEIGQLAEIGQKHLRPRAGLFQHRIGFVAQRLERLGEANARQRLGGGRGAAFSWCGDARDVEHRGRAFH